MTGTVQSLYERFVKTTESMPNHPAVVYFNTPHWIPIHYQALHQSIRALAGFLHQNGLAKGDRIGIYMQNRPEWVITDMATYALGAVVVPIYPTLSEHDVHYIINDSGLKVVVVDAHDRFQISSRAMGEHSTLTTVITTHQFSEIQAKKIDAPHVPVQRDDLASIVYTSGTTGQQKGVMLTHGNFLSNVSDILSVYDISSEDTALSFLPLSHVFERTAGYYTLIARGATIYYAQSHQTVAKDLQAVKPTLIISVPRLYEKIYEKIMSQATGLKKTLLNWAISVGKTEGIRAKVADYLVFSKIRNRTGGNLRFCVSGGAPLAPHLCHFFDTIGLLILEGYGLTETAPVIACNTENAYKFGTVGHPLPSVTVKVAEDGELIAYGPNMMKGYWNKDTETQKVLTPDGGILTGDIVTIDKEGYITIVDRKKNLIVLSNGKNIAPQYIEARVLKSDCIDQVMVVGDNQKFVSALIVPKWDVIQATQSTSDNTLTVDILIQKELDQYQSELSSYEKIKRFIIVEYPFTEDAGELTPTLKLKRNVIYKKYEKSIASLY